MYLIIKELLSFSTVDLLLLYTEQQLIWYSFVYMLINLTCLILE